MLLAFTSGLILFKRLFKICLLGFDASFITLKIDLV